VASDRRDSGGAAKRRYLIRELPAATAPVYEEGEATPAVAIPASERRDAPLPAGRSKSREEMIAEAAYYRASRRGFAPGDPVRDWLEAEREIDALSSPRKTMPDTTPEDER
jgi:hypothetical protein